MFMIDYKELSWWYWFATACLLTAGVAGYGTGFALAIGVSLGQLVHFAIREQSVTAFPVQVRFFFLVLMLAFFPEPMRIAYWLPVAGMWAQSLFGYCPMARVLSLMPWNRRVPFTRRLLMTTFFSRPVRGCILQGFLPARQTKGYT